MWVRDAAYRGGPNGNVDSAWLARARFGFHGWLGHRDDQWQAIRSEADSQKRDALPENIEIRGYDGDIGAIRKAEENIKRMGLVSEVRVRARQLSDVENQPTETWVKVSLW